MMVPSKLGHSVFGFRQFVLKRYLTGQRYVWRFFSCFLSWKRPACRPFLRDRKIKAIAGQLSARLPEIVTHALLAPSTRPAWPIGGVGDARPASSLRPRRSETGNGQLRPLVSPKSVPGARSNNRLRNYASAKVHRLPRQASSRSGRRRSLRGTVTGMTGACRFPTGACHRPGTEAVCLRSRGTSRAWRGSRRDTVFPVAGGQAGHACPVHAGVGTGGPIGAGWMGNVPDNRLTTISVQRRLPGTAPNQERNPVPGRCRHPLPSTGNHALDSWCGNRPRAYLSRSQGFYEKEAPARRQPIRPIPAVRRNTAGRNIAGKHRK